MKDSCNKAIKGVINYHPIIATNKAGAFPFNNTPVNSENPFYMRDFGNDNDPKIGRVQVIRNFNPTTLDLCVYNLDNLWLWDYDNYVFEPLVATKVAGEHDTPPIVENRSTEALVDDFKVQNPFNEALNLIIPTFNQESVCIILWLTNANGEIVLTKELDSTMNYFSLPVGPLSPGFYILHIKTNGKVQNLKVIKSE